MAMFFCAIALVSVESTYAITYALNVNAVCKVQANVVPCVPPFPGSAVNSSGQITAGSSIHLAVTSPSYSGVPEGQRWVLNGYLLWKDGVSQTPQPVNANSFDLVMDTNYNVTWAWYQEINLTLTSNYGSPNLVGGGWVPAGGQVQISAPQLFFIENSQYIFRRWLSGNVLISTNQTATVTVGTVPILFQAQFDLVTTGMTNTFTSTITTVINGSTITSTSTGVFAHDQVTVQLQILNQKLNVANANVTVLDDAGQSVYRGLSDQSGLTAQFQVKPNLIYAIKVQSLAQTFSGKQQFQTSGTYPVDIAGSNPLISLQALAPYAVLIIVVVIGVAALALYLNSRKAPNRPRTEWVSR